MIKLEEVGTIEDGGECTSCKGQYDFLDFLYMIDEHSHDGDETYHHEVCEMCKYACRICMMNTRRIRQCQMMNGGVNRLWKQECCMALMPTTK